MHLVRYETVDALWKTGDRDRKLSRGEARELLPMYTYEPSLSFGLEEDRMASPDGGSVSFFSGTPSSAASNRELDDPSVVVVSADGVVEIYRDLESQEDGLTPEARPDDQDDDVSPEARALLPAPNSCPRLGACCTLN